jgi:hypothetical protein
MEERSPVFLTPGLDGGECIASGSVRLFVGKGAERELVTCLDYLLSDTEQGGVYPFEMFGIFCLAKDAITQKGLQVPLNCCHCSVARYRSRGWNSINVT